jgi:pimeloyl-ACP methyl ester carboxylesterase
MSAASERIAPPSKVLLLLEEGRAIHEFGAFVTSLPLLRLAPKGDGHPVLVLPGLVASDLSTRPLRTFLSNHGYAVSGWRQGRNYGPRDGVAEGMIELVRETAQRNGRKVSLIGWSLGGVYARQLAKICPDEVRTVITLGSPFAADPRSTNAWRIYELASGKRADDRSGNFSHGLADPPPVPATAIFSRSDGVCAWRGCVEQRSALTENIEVHSSHCGLGHNPAVVYAVADRLAQPEGAWRPFDRSGWRSFVYPYPAR